MESYIRGDRIRQLREARDWKQLYLALTADISQGHLSHIESGDVAKIGTGILCKLYQALETNAEYLIGTISDPRPLSLLCAPEPTEEQQQLLQQFYAYKSGDLTALTGLVRVVLGNGPAYNLRSRD